MTQNLDDLASPLATDLHCLVTSLTFLTEFRSRCSKMLLSWNESANTFSLAVILSIFVDLLADTAAH